MAMVVILAVLFGIPFVLISVVGMPMSELLADVSDSLSSDNTRAAAALRLGLSVVVWLAWLQVAWAIVVEAVAALAGRVAGRSRLVVPAVQRSARQLVATAMLLLAGFTTPASAATLAVLHPPDFAVAETSMVDDVSSAGGNQDQAAESVRTTSTVATAHRTYTVRAEDTLWSIAESTTGDGFAWRSIRDDNLGRLMSDGTPITPSTEAIMAGTELLVPASGGSQADTRAGEVVVEPGDHFWVLAQDTLAAGWGRAPTDDEITPYWRDMIELNRDQLVPPSDPDLIHPGQHFVTPPLPEDPTFVKPPAADQDADFGIPQTYRSVEPGAEPPSSGSPASAPVEVAPDSAQLAQSVDTEAVRTPANRIEEARAPASDRPDPSGGSESGSSHAIPYGVVAISGLGLLTAGVARVIRRRQAIEMGRRQPGQRPRFSPPASADRLLTTTADEARLADLDTALRLVAAETRRLDLAMPELVGVMVGQSSIRLLLGSRHHGAPVPFRSVDGGMSWTVDRPLPPVDVRRAEGPYPSLVTMGHTAEAQLLVDLEYVGVMSLAGGLANVIDTMGTMAFELATSPLADTIEVVCVGFGEELADLERVTVVPTLDTVIERIDHHAAAVSELADESELTGPQGRAESVGDWTPMIVFDPLSELSPETDRLLTAVGKTGAGGVSAVVTAAGPIALQVEVTDDEVIIPAYDVSLNRAGIDRVQRSALAAAMADAARPVMEAVPDVATAVLGSLPPPPDDAVPFPGEAPADLNVKPASDSPPARSEVLVRILGPLRVETADGTAIGFDRSATPEFLAYLTRHRDGLAVETAMANLWPATTARRTWIANVHADARRVVSELLGDDVLPRPGADDVYRLLGGVQSDFEVFRQGVEAAVDLPVERAVEVLSGALELVEGIPYTNITNRWPISEGHWQEATMLVDEAARCAAGLALDQLDDPRLAAWAASKGLLANPHSVALHRLRLQAAMADDSDELGPHAVFQHYQATVMADDHQPEGGARLDPGIVELYESYRRSERGKALAASQDQIAH